uniref:Enoyl reductase (ER) domain-containing protein n=1 Tax=Globisporangium ultimum (strain ATCC 200006 / CBS 805.95 / DAOM BR144) TaxID=431595 RepID=K3WBZ5_GLOUD
MTAVPATLKQFQYTKWGTADAEWKIVEVPQKALKPNHVRIKVINAALNPVDYKISEFGAYWFGRTPTEEVPFIVGFDAAGTVVEVGSEVTDFKVGDDVFTRTPTDDFGAVAEYISVEAQYVAPKPKNQDFKEAAAIPLAGLTSYQSIVTRGELKAGERVLILGGSSSCGIFAVQLAKALGAHVIATASDSKVEFVKSLGADQVVNYTSEKWADVLDAHSIDLIYDCGFEPQAWNDAAQKILKKDAGRFVTLAQIQDPIESPIGAKWVFHFCQSSGKDLREMTKFIEKGQIKAIVDSVHPFESTVDANNKVKSGRVVGKVVISIAKE